MKLTKQEAIEKHRKMWNWIAEETEKRKQKVEKEAYFLEHGIEDIPDYDCYCCEYDKEQSKISKIKPTCKYCPIEWGDSSSDCMYLRDDEAKIVGYNLFWEWCKSIDWQEAARLAREIANLPERD